MQNKFPCIHSGCKKNYKNSFNLERHIKTTHMVIKKFKCDICDKELSSKQNLVDHNHIHTGERPYSCDHPGCDYQFKQLSQYYIHRQIHNKGPKPPQNFDPSANSILSLLGNLLSHRDRDLDVIMIQRVRNSIKDAKKDNESELEISGISKELRSSK